MPAKITTKLTPKNRFPQIFPYPVELLTQQPWHNFLKVNGYMKLSQKLNLQVFYKDEEIKELWNEFTPKKSVFDLYEVRDSFYRAYNFDPYFLTIFRQKG